MPCDGSCCVAFPLSGHPGVKVMEASPAQLRHPGNAHEWFTILGMIEPLTREQAVERRAAFGAPAPVGDDPMWFSCRHWDEETRLCRIYDRRPYLCRDYPGYGLDTACEHGCDCIGDLSADALSPTPYAFA